MFNKERINTWLYWIREREAIRQKREAGRPPPWTKDPIMAGTRFTNVRRMDDKVSRWLMNWYGPDLEPDEAVVAATFGRLVNRPETLDVYGPRWPGWSPKGATQALRLRAALKQPVFTGAYIINSATAGSSKIDTVVQITANVARRRGLVDMESMARTHARLKALPGIGSFIAGQIVADLRHMLPGTWIDRMSWAPLGPGSARGLAYLLGTTQPVHSQAVFEARLQEIIRIAAWRLPSVHEDRALEAMDYQNTLCELSKYVRITAGGRAKNKYRAVNVVPSVAAR